ncbi:hypothetical protein ACLB2K_017171 [Fragaria x ananassa]
MGVADGPLYDSTAYTECKRQPEKPLYGGGIIVNDEPSAVVDRDKGDVYSPAFLLKNLTENGTIYSFSSWVKLRSAGSALIQASLKAEDETYSCIGTVLAKQGCWSFLKGGFVLDSPSNLSILFFQDTDGRDVSPAIASASLQPFSVQQWNTYQQYMINTKRKRAVMVHVSNEQGKGLQGAAITVEQISKDFPFGSAISKTILGNLPYQNWFGERFNAAVFENELKWYATEPQQGNVTYIIADQMLQFVRANKITTRGHNIFWEDPKYTPAWVRNLTSDQLKSAVNSRIQSLMTKYKEDWDVSNEMLHFDFYEKQLGPDATLDFFQTAHKSDPLATLFMNEFNVVETCTDVNSTVDTYVSRLRELQQGGVSMDGVVTDIRKNTDLHGSLTMC